MHKTFICSPYRGDTAKNIEKAKHYCLFNSFGNSIPIAPHLYFTQFLTDESSSDRYKGIYMGLQLLAECDEVRVYADEVTEGMITEIKKAQELNIPVKFHNADMEEINYDSLIINDRIGPGYRKIIEDAHETCTGGSCPYITECGRVRESREAVITGRDVKSIAGSTGGAKSSDAFSEIRKGLEELKKILSDNRAD